MTQHYLVGLIIDVCILKFNVILVQEFIGNVRVVSKDYYTKPMTPDGGLLRPIPNIQPRNAYLTVKIFRDN